MQRLEIGGTIHFNNRSGTIIKITSMHVYILGNHSHILLMTYSKLNKMLTTGQAKYTPPGKLNEKSIGE